MCLRFFILILCLNVLISCSDNPNRQAEVPAKTDSSVSDNYIRSQGLDIEPALKNTDSLQILFYDNPDGDSLRYTRFYQYATSKDSILINAVLADLNQPFEQRSEVKKCRSEGKMYMYGGANPLKTIYFSTRCDSCCYFYFIKEGNFLYFPLSDKMSANLKEIKATAKKP